MGGPGSGNRSRWRHVARKTTVEECLRLSTSSWKKAGILTAGTRKTGTWVWTYPSGNRFWISYDVTTVNIDSASARVAYSWTLTGERQVRSADYMIGLATTRPHLGGLRWWFTCPLVIGGRACRRRVANLHLPAHAPYFGCRACHDLTYASCQDAHKDDGLYRRLAGNTSYDVATIKRVLRGPGKRRG